MPRGGARPRKPGSVYGRPSKGGEQITVRLSAEASVALRSLREGRGLTTTQAVEAALLALDQTPGAHG